MAKSFSKGKVMTFTSLEQLQQSFASYIRGLEAFLCAAEISSDMYALPLDHVAIKLIDGNDYEQTMAIFRPLAQAGGVAHLNERRIATLELTQTFDFGSFGQTRWLEIMEPRPAKVGKDFVGFEHIELIIKDEAALKRRFAQHNLHPEICQNAHHTAYAFKINESGQEVKFTSNPLAQVVEDELRSGTAEAIN